MIRYCIIVCFTLVALLSCKIGNDESNSSINAKGGMTYGGVFKFSIPNKPLRLYPYASNSYYEQLLISQLYETLFVTDSMQQIIGNLAEKYEVRDRGKTLRIVLRKGILFHGGGQLTTRDVLFSIAFACSKSSYNKYAYLLIDKILGGKEFYDTSSDGPLDLTKFSGAKIINEQIIDVYLALPYSQFPKLLTHPNLVILSFQDYVTNSTKFFGNAKGTGPFQLESISNEKTILTRNNSYWKKDSYGNKLPFLNSIEVYYSVNESALFQEGKLDLIQNVRADKLNALFGSLQEAQGGKNLLHRLFQQQDKNLNFLVYNTKSPIFNTLAKRLVVDQAIDKKSLCANILEGDGEACLGTFVPINYYRPIKPLLGDKTTHQGQKQGKAKRAKGKNAEILNFFINKNTSEIGRLWVKEVANQIENATNFKVTIVSGSDADLEKMWKTGEVHLAKYGWVADYLDPDSYLGLFYSKSSLAGDLEINLPRFDSLYLNTFKKNTFKDHLFAQFECDQYLIKQVLVTPVFLQDFIFVLNVNMRGFHINTSGQFNLSTVYFKPIQKLY